MKTKDIFDTLIILIGILVVIYILIKILKMLNVDLTPVESYIQSKFGSQKCCDISYQNNQIYNKPIINNTNINSMNNSIDSIANTIARSIDIKVKKQLDKNLQDFNKELVARSKQVMYNNGNIAQPRTTKQNADVIDMRQLDMTVPKNRSIDENFTVNAGSTYTTSIVPNSGFNTAKLTANVRFTGVNTAGLTVDLYYGSSRIGEVMNVTNTRGVNHMSESFDVQYLDGFNFVITNKDPTNNTFVNNLRIVLYNDQL